MRKTLANPILTLPGAVVFVLAVASTGMGQQKKDDVNQQAMEWLREIQSSTVQVIDHAQKLEMMTHHAGAYPRQSHEFELLSIRDRINDIGDLVPRLQKREDAPAWQTDIIDEVASLLAAMSAQTEKAFDFVRGDPEDPLDPTTATLADIKLNSNAYEARVVSIGHYAEHINELIDYADTRAELKRMQEQTHFLTSQTSD